MVSKHIIAVVLLLLLLTLSGAVSAEETIDLSEFSDYEDVQVWREWTYPISYELLTSSDTLVLANQESLLDSEYVPQDLVKLTCRKISSDPIQMRQVAAEALSELFDAAKADGVTLYAHSGYRSYRTQKTMYYNRLKKNNGKDDGVVAYPGSSDHQTGLGIDVINKAGIGKKFTSAFASTKEGQWLAEHCWDYGFVIRYQKDKEDITRIIYEPWHLRYVGVEAARHMRDHNLCLEEFTQEWKEAVSQYDGTGAL